MDLHTPLDLSVDRLPAAPLDVHAMTVAADWIDYNGHMNVACYVMAFDKATDRFFDLLDIGEAYAARENKSAFVLETHVTYDREVTLGDSLRFSLQVIDCDEKRLHYFLEMFHATQGYLSASSELLVMHVDLAARRSAPFPEAAQARIEAMMAAHRDLPRPARAGASIGIRRRG